MTGMTWRDVLAAGALDPRIRRFAELLEEDLEAQGEGRAEIERDMNLAVQVNLEAYGQDFVHTALAYIARAVEQGMEVPEAIGAFFLSLPIYVDFDPDDDDVAARGGAER